MGTRKVASPGSVAIAQRGRRVRCHGGSAQSVCDRGAGRERGADIIVSYSGWLVAALTSSFAELDGGQAEAGLPLLRAGTAG
jgi:hypothetical protein